ncbi:Putative apoptosis-inducing factor 1, mitochondrial [Galdieria sulphuraria]|nr:Putative apoptosis-inducing factor 1, mitochondrial [Galdieria sulphuraria]
MVLLWAFYTNDCLYTIHTSSIIKSWSDVLFVHSEPGKYYKYVVIGTGEAAREAVEVIRTKDPNGSLFILSDKTMEEYSRPRTSTLLRKKALSSLKQVKVEKLDIAHNRILLSGGEWVRYGKLLLSPADYLELPWDILVAKDCTNYVHWRIWELDKEELNKLSSGWTAKSNSLPHITIVGGGFPITMVFPEPSILARYLPRYLCDYISSKLKAKGVDLVSYALIRYVSKSPSSTESHLHVHISRTYDSTNIGYFDTDYLFFVPTHMSSGLLRWSADVEDILEMDVLNGGILCNAELLAASDVYVAGSAVSFPNRFIGRRREQGSEHNLLSGRVVGVNMSGGREYYRHIPMREMELSDICMPMFLFGDIDSSYDSASYFHVDHYLRQQKKIRDWNVIPIGGLSRYLDGVERGVLFFLRDNQVVGICLWNVTDSNSHQMARTLVRDAVSASNLRQIASQLLLCETKDEQLIEKSSLGRTTHPYQSHYGGPLNRNHNHSSLPFYSTKTSSSKHLTTSLDPKKNEILWETKDYFVSGRTQNDLKNQAFRKAILGY